MEVYDKTRFNVAVECFFSLQRCIFTDSAAALNLIRLRYQISKLGYGREEKKYLDLFLFTKFYRLLKANVHPCIDCIGWEKHLLIGLKKEERFQNISQCIKGKETTKYPLKNVGLNQPFCDKNDKPLWYAP